MAGRARRKAIIEALDRRRRAFFEIDAYSEPGPSESILDYIAEWIGSAKLFKDLAHSLAVELGYDELWPDTLRRILDSEFTTEAVAPVLKASRGRASQIMAEDSVAIVDAANGDSSSEVSKAAAQARTRQWLAEKFSPEAFGVRAGQNVTIHVGQLHLAALRHVNATPHEVTAAFNVLADNTDTPIVPASQPIAITSVSQ